jgi:hypothetical protein
VKWRQGHDSDGLVVRPRVREVRGKFGQSKLRPSLTKTEATNAIPRKAHVAEYIPPTMIRGAQRAPRRDMRSPF